MKNFDYHRVGTFEEASQAVRSVRGARLLAGGTDLVPLMKEGIVRPPAVVDLGGCRDAKGIAVEADEVRIGALVSLSEIAEHEEINKSLRALADACRLAASPQLRNMGTIGGNLLQQTRCWYYRGEFDCWLKGGSACYARDGENEQHAIFFTRPDESQCVSAHPSDPAAALLALNARVRVLSGDGEAEMPLEELYALPTQARRSFHTLSTNAIITGVVLPRPAGSQVLRSAYSKAMARAAWSFALAGVAIALILEGESITEARIALSGVAPIPMRASAAEQALVGSTADARPDELAEMVVSGARPLANNGYKLPLLKGLFKETLARVLA